VLDSSDNVKDIKLSLLERLKSIDKKDIEKYNVVLLPDFFVDHFLSMDKFYYEIPKLKKIYNQGGGNIPEIKQKIQYGGNAVNTAITLSKLGIKTHIICRTDKFGLYLLKYFIGKNCINIDNVKIDGKLAITTALEFGEKHVNVMLNDNGSVSDFGFESLNDKDLDKISQSDMVCVTNWSLNKKGTNLAKNVFNYAKKYQVKTFFDTGDPQHRKNDISNLKKEVLNNLNLDVLSINENELKHYSNLSSLKNKNDVIESANNFSKKISARLDLHTSDFSYSTKKEKIIVPTLNLGKIYRSTGSGDTWNAGDIFSDLLDFKDEQRLFFSNLIAGMYISLENPYDINLKNIIDFLEKL